MKKLSTIIILGITFWGNSKAPQAACPTLLMSGTAIDCYGNNTGSAKVTATSGSDNYSYNWSNGENTPTISGLAAGTYTVTVKDNVSGCSVVGAYVVNSPDPIFTTHTIQDVQCFGAATGEIQVTTAGGSGSYNFEWLLNGNPVGNGEDLTNATAGNYTLNITDGNLCTYSKDFVIQQPVQALQSSETITNVDCFANSTGSIDVSVWGGTPSYTYLWSTGASTQDLSNATATNYSLTITDFNGCQLVKNFSISQPTAISGSHSVVNADCYGALTGSITYSPAGGTAPYSYSWQNETTVYASNNATLSNVPAGNYTVFVTDANNCGFTDNMTISQPSELTETHTVTNVSCNGGNDGNINVTTLGGTLPYTFQWTNMAGASVSSDEDLINVVADVYTLNITDNNNCSINFTEEITQPSLPITVTESVANVLCFGNNTGAIDLSVIGGTAPYTFSWNTSQTSEDISGLLANVYTYVVTDAKGCTYTDTVLVRQPSNLLIVSNIITDVACFGDSSGTIDLTVSGGTTPYSHDWINSTYQLSATTEDIVGFPADWYISTVTDANNCVQIDTLTISEPTKLESTISGVNILCKYDETGSVDLTVTGGTAPYNYVWNSGQTTQDLINVGAGDYSATITDANNCVALNEITLTEPQDSLSSELFVTDVKCNDGSDGEIQIVVAGGTTPYSYDWSSGHTISTAVNLTYGYYSCLVTDNNGCTLTDSTLVNQPGPLVLNEVITPVTCNGLSDGIINITPSGGTLPYSFTWFNSDFGLSAQTEDLAGFPADTYQLEIIDSNNCFYEMFLELEQPDSLKISYEYNLVSCFGGTDGNIDVTVTGGNPEYTFGWSNGTTTEDQLNVPFGNYNLTVTDTKSCQDSIKVVLSQPEPITVNFETQKISCIDQNDGIAYAYPEGGNGGYLYDWSNGETESINSGLSNQEYSVLVTDILGCTGTNTIFIPIDSSFCVFPVNAFSPNGDDYNDTWVIDNMELYPNANIQIFNKWGENIHEQTGIYEAWNGTHNGNPMPSETYYYIINLNQEDRRSITGTITIIR